ncbi:MAG: CDP-alcohol phosphatidyltransferase family protein [Chlamydiota bacterium]|nr:CDP-alcohol phosphatidyltransferase family protein [Chlamydiota bacterium]
MKRSYLIPNMITALGLACGLFLIFKITILSPTTPILQILDMALLLLLLAGLADLLDGAMARIIGAQSPFGASFDSLSDAISFGVAPSAVFLKVMSLQEMPASAFLSLFGAMIYTMCGVLRLVRFTLQTSQSHQTKADFIGLPIPAGSVAALSLMLLLFSPPLVNVLHPWVRSIGLTIWMIFLGYLMINRWHFPSVKTLKTTGPSFGLLFIGALIALVCLYGIFHYHALLFTVFSLGYVLLGGILTFSRSRKRKQ